MEGDVEEDGIYKMIDLQFVVIFCFNLNEISYQIYEVIFMIIVIKYQKLMDEIF